MLIRYYSIALS